jgi:hypothetical protein
MIFLFIIGSIFFVSGCDYIGKFLNQIIKNQEIIIKEMPRCEETPEQRKKT